MKKFALLTAIAVVGLLTANNVQASFISTNALLTQVKLTALVQAPETVKSNSNGTVITETVKTTKVKITSQDILNLLATEFGDNFDGDQLAYSIDTEGFEVADANGAIIQNVLTNLADPSYFFNITNATVFDSASEIEKGSVTDNTTTTNTTESITIYEADESLSYVDGNGNDFHVTGLLTEVAKVVEIPAANTIPSAKLSISPVQGGGTFFNPIDDNFDDAIMTGSITIAGKNLSE